MPASDIAKSVTIIQAASPSAPGFGVASIAVTLTAPQDALWGPNLIREFRQDDWQATLISLGFVDGDSLYEELELGFAQAVVPEKVLVGKRATAVAQIREFDLGDADVAPIGTYRITLDDGTGAIDFDEVLGAPSTRTLVVAALVATIDASPKYGAALGADTERIDVTAAVAGIGFSSAASAPTPEVWITTTLTPNVGLSTDILDWNAERTDWYFVTELSRSAAIPASMVGPVASFPRAIVFGSQVDSATDPNATDGTNATRAASSIVLSQRVFIAYVPTATDHDLAALYFRALPEDPGSITWTNIGAGGEVAIRGIDGDTYSSTQTAGLRGEGTDKGNYWYFEKITTLSSGGISRNTWMGDKTPFDLVRGRDWLDATIETDVGQALIIAPKISYTDPGSEQIIGVIGGSLAKAQNAGVIVGDFTVTTIARDAQAPADVGARKWRGFAWTATLAGAIESVEISGQLFIV